MRERHEKFTLPDLYERELTAEILQLQIQEKIDRKRIRYSVNIVVERCGEL
jgi:hypothetical protein